MILRGNILFAPTPEKLEVCENGYLVVDNGLIKGVYEKIPDSYAHFPIVDHGEKLIIPGMTDLHIHAPQYAFRGVGMDMQLLEWLETITFREEARYQDEDYARQAYGIFAEKMRKSASTRACIFGTLHRKGTLVLMDLMEQTGLISYVGKVSMDRNCPDDLRERSAEEGAGETVEWIKDVLHKKYERTRPILTPRFIPSCSDALMEKLKMIQMRYDLPVQSHLSENQEEIRWVQSLCPDSTCYGDAYDRFGLFGADCRTIMAHCVYSGEEEMERMKENGVFAAHCPESNANLSSGIAPAKKFLKKGIDIGLGTDVAAGTSENLFRAMSMAIQMSKIRWRLVDSEWEPLTLEEVFYMATKGGGAFFGKVGSFEPDYEADILILDDARLAGARPAGVKERLERMLYLADEREIFEKYVKGSKI